MRAWGLFTSLISSGVQNFSISPGKPARLSRPPRTAPDHCAVGYFSREGVTAYRTFLHHFARYPYGRSTRDIEIVTGTGHWYRIGEALVAVRWVYIHDCTGTHRDEYLFTTDLQMPPQQIVEGYTQRWSIETTFQECREHLKLESTKCDGQQTVLRFTPCLFGLYTIVVLLYLQLPDLLRLPIMLSWRGKSTTTFADMLMCVRRVIWQQWFFQTPMTAEPFSKLPRLLQETILYALTPAA